MPKQTLNKRRRLVPLKTMKVSEKSKKLAGVIEEYLPNIIKELLTPNQIGFLTVSALELSGDLKVADVFVSTIGAPKDYLKSLRKITAKIQYELAKKVPRQFVIKLRFKENQAHKNVQKINKLLS